MYAERLAHDLRMPLVRLVDGTGGGGSVKTLEQMGFSYVPPLPGFDLVVAQPRHRAGGRGRARPRGRPGRGEGGVLALLGDRAGHGPAVRGRAAGGGGGHGRSARQGGARRARGCRRGPVRSTTWPPTRTTRSPSSGVFSPTCPATSGRRRRSPRPATRPTGARRSCSRSSRATAGAPTRCAACWPPCSTRARCSSWEARSAAPRSPPWPAWRAGRSACWPPTPSTTAAGSPRTPPRRPPASSTSAISSTCRS